MATSVHPRGLPAISGPLLALAGASVLFAACSSSSKASSPPATNAVAPAAGSATTVGSPSSAAGSSASDASVTVKAANVTGLGTVLVNGDGLTLYVLAPERGGKVTCTASGSCTKYWPPAVLPSGMAHGIAGNGVQASLLGTATSPSGDVRLTYAGWPLYTYVSDTRPGQATGQGVKDSFGVWWALSPSGAPITTAASSSATTAPSTTAAPASGGAGF